MEKQAQMEKAAQTQAALQRARPAITAPKIENVQSIKVNPEEMKEKLENQLKLQRAQHVQKRVSLEPLAVKPVNNVSTPQQVIKIMPKTPRGEFKD